jgi:hypothetical protein
MYGITAAFPFPDTWPCGVSYNKISIIRTVEYLCRPGSSLHPNKKVLTDRLCSTDINKITQIYAWIETSCWKGCVPKVEHKIPQHVLLVEMSHAECQQNLSGVIGSKRHYEQKIWAGSHPTALLNSFFFLTLLNTHYFLLGGWKFSRCIKSLTHVDFRLQRVSQSGRCWRLQTRDLRKAPEQHVTRSYGSHCYKVKSANGQVKIAVKEGLAPIWRPKYRF